MSEPSTEVSDAPVAYENNDLFYERSPESTRFSYDLKDRRRIDVLYDPEVRRFNIEYFQDGCITEQIGSLVREPSIVTVDALVKELEPYGPVPDALRETMEIASHGKEPFPPWKKQTYRPCDTLNGDRVSPEGDQNNFLTYETKGIHKSTELHLSLDYTRGRIKPHCYFTDNDTREETIYETKGMGVTSVQELETALLNIAEIPEEARLVLEQFTKLYPPRHARNDTFQVEIHEDDRYTVIINRGNVFDMENITPNERLTRPELTTFLSSYGLDQGYIDTVIEKTSFDIGVNENQQFGYTGFDKSGWLPENEFAYPSDKGGHVLVYWNPHDNQFMAGLESMGGGPCEPLGTEEPVNTLDELALVVEPHGALPERFKVMVAQAKRQHAEEHKTENNLEHSSEEREISTSGGR